MSVIVPEVGPLPFPVRVLLERLATGPDASLLAPLMTLFERTQFEYTDTLRAFELLLTSP